MKKILAMMFGSASVSALNLASLTLVATRVDLAELDVYFLYRDAGESLLKLLFISQIGALCVSAVRMWNGGLTPVRRTLIVGAIATSVVMLLWAAYFHTVAPHFFPDKSLLPPGGFGTVEIAIAVFCIFVWIDSASSPTLINQRRFWTYHLSNFGGAAVTFLGIAQTQSPSIAEVAIAFAVGRFFSAIPKLTLCLLLPSPSDASRPEGISNPFRMAVSYIPPNALQQVNRIAFLAGAAFLQPGAFALFSLFHRYHTGLQNLVTMNLFNLSSSSLSKADVNPADLRVLIFRHAMSFLLLVIGISTFMYITTFPAIKNQVPGFLVSDIAPLLWCIVILGFLPDGVNLILSRCNIFQGAISWDSRVSAAQVLVNTVALYPSMKYFGVYGLAYATFIVLTVFAIIRSWKLVQCMPELRPLLIAVLVYGCSLFLLSVALINESLENFCVGIIAAGLLALFHAFWRLR